MKEFKKWEDEDCIERECPSILGKKVSCKVCESLRAAGWKGALECVTNMFNTNIMSLAPPYNVSEEVEKELRS